jgi:putative photosynthetic complex assembly protein 2
VSNLLIPALFATLLWWGSTGLILALVRLRPETFQRSFGVSCVLGVVTLGGLALLARQASVAAAYGAFTLGIVLWGCNEITFLMGRITGPRRSACPAGVTGFQRFRFATEAVITHELALVASILAIAAVTWGAENQAGLWAFIILWVLRLSSKINLFLGVANTGKELLPVHLVYLGSYFGKPSMNRFFPLSVTTSTLAAGALVVLAVQASDGSMSQTGFALLAALTALGLIEHWIMMLPVEASYVWRIFLTANKTKKEVATEPSRASGTV